MKLFYKKSACSLLPHIVAKEIGVELTLVKVDFSTGIAEDGTDFRALNPKGYIPALLLDNGTVMTEGLVIAQYIANLKPQSTIAPPLGTDLSFKMQEWLVFIAMELHKNISPLIMDVFYEAKPGEAWLSHGRAALTKHFTMIDKILSQQTYLVDKHVTCADIYLYLVVSWAIAVKLDLTAYPHIMRLFNEIAERPAVKAAQEAEVA